MVEPRTLADVARAYTQGRLESWEVEAFEERLAVDQSARDALVVAVQEQAGPDAGRLRPDPAYRQEVLRRLTPATWWAWCVRLGAKVRPAWVGSLAALVLVLVGVWALPQPATVPTAPPLVVAPPLEETQPDAVAKFWTDLPRGQHLARAVEEEAARKVLRVEGNRPGQNDATAALPPPVSRIMP